MTKKGFFFWTPKRKKKQARKHDSLQCVCVLNVDQVPLATTFAGIHKGQLIIDKSEVPHIESSNGARATNHSEGTSAARKACGYQRLC